MISRNQSGLIGFAVAVALLYLFFFHIVGLFLLAIAAVIGYPIGVIIYFLKRKKALE